MFKVKEHIALANSEVYVWHFWGHYVFLPLYFSTALVAWLAPRRWRLPAPQLERLSTSVRIIARLLWTVHLDYSEAVGRRRAALARPHAVVLRSAAAAATRNATSPRPTRRRQTRACHAPRARAGF